MNEPKRRALQMFEELRERICLLDYKPGEIIKERELAEEFGVSRTPLRRVLQRLESDGLIVSRQGHGTVVTEIDVQELRDIYFLRIKLAELIGSSEPHEPGRDELEALVDLAQRATAVLDAPDFRIFGEINIGLHKQFQGLIRNRTLRDVSDKLFYQTSRMWFRLLSEANWSEEIGDLLQEITSVRHFLEAGDVESAGFVHRNHLSAVIRRLNHNP